MSWPCQGACSRCRGVIRSCGSVLVTPLLLFVWVGRLIELTGIRWLPFLGGIIGYSAALLPAFARGTLAWLLAPNIRLAVPYGKHRRNELDIYLPIDIDLALRAGKPVNELPSPRGVLLFAPGGAWAVGFRGWAALLGMRCAQNGILVFCADYRNFPQADCYESVQDAQRALGWVQRNAWRFGWRGGPVWVSGQSAGAHILSLALLERSAREHADYIQGKHHDELAPPTTGPPRDQPGSDGIAGNSEAVPPAGTPEANSTTEAAQPAAAEESLDATIAPLNIHPPPTAELRQSRIPVHQQAHRQKQLGLHHGRDKADVGITEGSERDTTAAASAADTRGAEQPHVLTRRLAREQWSGAVFNRRSRVQTSMLGDLGDFPVSDLHLSVGAEGRETGYDESLVRVGGVLNVHGPLGSADIAASNGATAAKGSVQSVGAALLATAWLPLAWVLSAWQWTVSAGRFCLNLIRWVGVLAVTLPGRAAVWTFVSLYVALQGLRGNEVQADDLVWVTGSGASVSGPKAMSAKLSGSTTTVLQEVSVLEENEWQQLARWLSGIADFGMEGANPRGDQSNAGRSSKVSTGWVQPDNGRVHGSTSVESTARSRSTRDRDRTHVDTDGTMRGRWLDWIACPYPRGLWSYGSLQQQPDVGRCPSKPTREGRGTSESMEAEATAQGWDKVGLHRVAGVLLMSGPYDLEAAAKQFMRRGMSIAMLCGIMGGHTNLRRMSPSHRLGMGLKDGVLPVPRGAHVPQKVPHHVPQDTSDEQRGKKDRAGSNAAAQASQPETRQRSRRDGSLPPFWLLHGEADRCVGPESSVEFAEALRGHGVPAECLVLDGVTHTDPILEMPMEGFDLASEAVLAAMLPAGGIGQGGGVGQGFDGLRSVWAQRVAGKQGSEPCCGSASGGCGVPCAPYGGTEAADVAVRNFREGAFDGRQAPIGVGIEQEGWEGPLAALLALGFGASTLTPRSGESMVWPSGLSWGRWFNPF